MVPLLVNVPLLVISALESLAPTVLLLVKVLLFLIIFAIKLPELWLKVPLFVIVEATISFQFSTVPVLLKSSAFKVPPLVKLLLFVNVFCDILPEFAPPLIVNSPERFSLSLDKIEPVFVNEVPVILIVPSLFIVVAFIIALAVMEEVLLTVFALFKLPEIDNSAELLNIPWLLTFS